MKRCLILLLVFLSSFTCSAAAESYNDDFRYSVTPEDSLLSEDTDLNDPASVMEDLNA